MIESTQQLKVRDGSSEAIKSRLQWYTLARPLAILVFLLAPFVIGKITIVTALEPLIETSFLLLGIVSGATFIYALLLRFSTHYRIQAYIQMTGDVFLVTWMVQLSGIFNSPYTALYLIVIFSISCLTSRRGTFVLTGVMSACYVALANNQPELLAQYRGSVSYTLFAFLAVAFLSSHFNEQLSRTDEDIAQVHRKLNDMRASSERIIDSISSGLVTIDLNHHILTFNRAAEEITGYKSQTVVGKHLSFLFPTMMEELESGKHSLMSGQAMTRLNLECKTSDERHIQLGFSISPLMTDTRKVTGFVLPFQDLTDVMRLERDVRRQDRLAALGRVAAAIAHEIRNPLASMRGAVQVLGSDSRLSDEETQLMNIVLRESDRIDRIISDFLMYAKPRQPEIEAVNLNDLLEDTLALLRYSTEFEVEKYQLMMQPFEPESTVMVDPGQVRQVLWNLSLNAIKAMPDGGTLKISITKNTELPGFQIAFSDTGIGMSEEQIERIFEPFSSFSSGGTGLGMSIVYHIIKEHGGKIDVASEIGVGTTITVGFAEQAQILSIEAGETEEMALEKAFSVAIA